METRYKRSMGCSYMILQEQESDSCSNDSYQMHIFLDNQISGLLPCRVQRVNGEELFYYEITGCQNIVHLYEKNKFQRQDLEKLFLAAVKIVERLDEYLMERNHLIFNPSYVYQNMDNGTYLFVWFPFSGKTAEMEFRSLTEYILPKINHEDKAAVTIGYGVYRESMEDYMNTDAIRQQIFSGKEVQRERLPSLEKEEYDEIEEREKEEQRQKILDDFYGEEEEEKNFYWTMPCVILLILVLTGMYLFRRNPYVLAAGGILLAAGILGVGFWYILKNRRNVQAEKIPEEYLYTENDEVSKEQRTKQNVQKTDREEEMTIVLNENMKTGACLKCMDGITDEVYSIEKENILIGKKKDSVDIWINVPTVSRIHAKIIHRTEGDYLVDLNSRNGTLINGEYLNPEDEYLLKNESMIVFAQVKFIYFSSN